MSDGSGSSKPAPPSIPSWQRAQSTTKPSVVEPPETSPEEPKQQPASNTATEASETSVTETAATWLEDPSIRNASRERKVAFLLSKGVSREEIDRLLAEKQAPAPPDEPKVVHASSGGAKTPQDFSQAPAQAQTQSQPSRSDVPPVITYPEFLLHAREKPPLVTTQGLLTTAYVSGGLMATIYGLSKYIVTPMAETLSVARHDFLVHSASQVDEFNTRLVKNVSALPPSLSGKPAHTVDSDDVEPPSPTDSDPTELFHRDMGTQTTPELSKPDDTDSSTEDEAEAGTTIRHETRLKVMTSQLASLRSSADAHTEGSVADLRTTLGDLTTYLTDMSYSSPYYGYGYGGIDGRGVGGGLNYAAGAADGGKKEQSDAVDALKAEIRGVKGVLLSARNFPGTKPVSVTR